VSELRVGGVFLALNGFTSATAGAPASPVLNGHAGAFSQSHTATPAIYGTSAFFQLASPSATFPAVRSTLSYSLIIFVVFVVTIQ